MKVSGAGRAARRAVAAVFLINGFGISTWLPRIPEVKDALDLSTARLGIALTGVGLGGLVGSFLAGPLVARLGSRRATVGAGLVLAVSLGLLGLAPGWLALLLALAVTGFADALTDVSMNAHAIRVQMLHPRPILNGFHAAWSVGAMAGALVGSLAAAVAFPVPWQMGIMTVVVTAALLAAAPRMLPDVSTAPAFAGPRPRLRGLGPLAAVALCVGVLEGAPGDWGALFLRDLGVAPGAAGLAFTVFAAAMLAGRLAADSLVHRWGRAAVVRGGTLLAAFGFGGALAVGMPWAVYAGFALTGIGVAPVFPAMFAAGGELPGLSEGVGIAGTSVLARIGFMVGPFAIGAAAEATGSLRVGLALAPLAALIVAAAAPAVGERRHDATSL